MTRPPLRLGVVSGLLLLGVAVGQGLSAVPGEDRPSPLPTASVESAAAVCVDLRRGEGQAARVAVGLAPGKGATDQDEDTVVDRRVVGESPREPLAVTAAGQALAEAGATPEGAATAVEARGPSAAGLTAVSTAQASGGGERGLVSAECVPARTDAWLLGGGATVGDASVLVLVNPEPVEAAVDVTVLSTEGAPDTRPGRGLTVPADGSTVVELDTLAPDRSALAVRVQATRGRVASVLRHSRSGGAVARGLAVAAASDGPAEELVVPALPSGPGGRAVLLANPGSVDVVARVELTTGEGQFVPDGLDALVVPAESTLLTDLSGPLGTTPAALRITSSGGPLLAAGVADDAARGTPARDFAYLAAVPPMAGPGLVPDVPVDGVLATTLLLSAVTGDAVVDVELRPVVGGADPVAPRRRVEVPGGRTVAVALHELVRSEFRGRVAVVVRPDRVGAPVHASVVSAARPADGPLLTVLPLRGSRPDVAVPRVVRDPAVTTR